MRIAICDDSPAFLQAFHALLIREFQNLNCPAEVISCGSGSILLQQLAQTPVDALFLDIDMPEMDGFEAAKKLQALHSPPLLVFTTSMDDMVYRSFPYSPFDYLRKSVLSDLPRIVKRIVETIEQSRTYYEIPLAGAVERVAVSNILFFDVSDHYVTLHTAEGTQTRYKARLSDIEAQLSGLHFVRCHTGFLVNCRFMQRVDKAALLLLNGQQLPISRNRLNATQTAFTEYMRSQRI